MQRRDARSPHDTTTTRRRGGRHDDSIGRSAACRHARRAARRSELQRAGARYLAVTDALIEHPRIRLIVRRHESGAAFMAVADADVAGVVEEAMTTDKPVVVDV